MLSADASNILQRCRSMAVWLSRDYLLRSVDLRYNDVFMTVFFFVSVDKISQPGFFTPPPPSHTQVFSTTTPSHLVLPNVNPAIDSAAGSSLACLKVALHGRTLSRHRECATLQHLQTKFDRIWRCGWIDQAVLGLLVEQI